MRLRSRSLRDFYPRPPRGGRLFSGVQCFPAIIISIHALREEGDPKTSGGNTKRNAYFYPRPPRGGRHIVCRKSSGHLLFLSTPSARRATYRLQKEQRTPPISIHALREEGDRERLQRSHRDHQISIHALREEGDRAAPAGSWPAIAFLSTPSARRATIRFRPVSTTHCNFYPRPPRGGRPIRPPAPCCPGRYFYPRPPRGGRHFHRDHTENRMRFLSTPSARRATAAR